ncbi:hypothetical protein [Lichenicola sp.]|uniref:hypothetical protein n=1 Tax=Lichenicola sp. TaxID=2804529 RepID=UPI003B0021F9
MGHWPTLSPSIFFSDLGASIDAVFPMTVPKVGPDRQLEKAAARYRSNDAVQAALNPDPQDIGRDGPVFRSRSLRHRRPFT